MRIDGYSNPIDLKVQLKFEKDKILCSFDGTSGLDKKGINVPLVYTKAYACYALKCAIAPEIPNNAASLAPFEITAPENSILNAVHPAPVALRHVIGHMVPDTVYDALDKMLPGKVPSATAFPSGVMTMPIEATEHVGPVIIWRKELRPDSGGAGQYRGGLGQYMEVGAAEGHEFDFQAMFDRVEHPARGRQGGLNGAPTTIARDDDTAMKGKGKQFVPHGRRVMLAFPGGAGYGSPSDRDPALVRRDLARGYISAEACIADYGLSQSDVDTVLEAVKQGQEIS